MHALGHAVFGIQLDFIRIPSRCCTSQRTLWDFAEAEDSIDYNFTGSVGFMFEIRSRGVPVTGLPLGI